MWFQISNIVRVDDTSFHIGRMLVGVKGTQLREWQE